MLQRLPQVLERIETIEALLQGMSQPSGGASEGRPGFCELLGTALPAAWEPASAGSEPGMTRQRASGSHRFDAIIERAASREGLSADLIHAVVRAESGYDPGARSSAGAMGLMQLMPGTARGLGVTDPWDPEQNVFGGARYLRQQIERFGDLELALAAYNAGPGAVSRHGGIPPYRETQTCVRRVLSYLEERNRVTTDASQSDRASASLDMTSEVTAHQHAPADPVIAAAIAAPQPVAEPAAGERTGPVAVSQQGAVSGTPRVPAPSAGITAPAQPLKSGAETISLPSDPDDAAGDDAPGRAPETANTSRPQTSSADALTASAQPAEAASSVRAQPPAREAHASTLGQAENPRVAAQENPSTQAERLQPQGTARPDTAAATGPLSPAEARQQPEVSAKHGTVQPPARVTAEALSNSETTAGAPSAEQVSTTRMAAAKQMPERGHTGPAHDHSALAPETHDPVVGGRVYPAPQGEEAGETAALRAQRLAETAPEPRTSDLSVRVAEPVATVTPQGQPAGAGIASSAAEVAPAPEARLGGGAQFDLRLQPERARQLAGHLSTGGTERLVVEVDPPQLGRCELELTVRDGQLRATVVADRPETVATMLAARGQIRAQLAEQGLDVTQFDVRAGSAPGGADDGTGRHGRPPLHQTEELPRYLGGLQTAEPLLRGRSTARHSTAIDLVA